MKKIKKIVMAGDLNRQYGPHMSFLGRSDIRLFEAATNDDILKVHIREKADLIITRIDLPGRKSEELFDIIRSSKGLQNTLSIILSVPDRIQLVRCTQCAPNLVLTLPVDPNELNRSVLQLLGSGHRASRRITYSSLFLARSDSDPFDCTMLNVSSTGFLFHSHEELAEGEAISFSFLLPDQTPVDGFAEINRVSRKTTPPYGIEYAVRFRDIARSVQDAIDRFIAERP